VTVYLRIGFTQKEGNSFVTKRPVPKEGERMPKPFDKERLVCPEQRRVKYRDFSVTEKRLVLSLSA